MEQLKVIYLTHKENVSSLLIPLFLSVPSDVALLVEITAFASPLLLMTTLTTDHSANARQATPVQSADPRRCRTFLGE